MSESKAVLREGRDQYKKWYNEEVERRYSNQERHEEEIAVIDKVHAKTVTLHQIKYASLVSALENVYGISVDTLLKADAFKHRQAQAAELMDAYTEAISTDPSESSESSEQKGKN